MFKTLFIFLNHYLLQETPFVNWKQPADGLNGNARFEGFMIDLLNELSKNLKFTFTMQIVGDNKYGGYNASEMAWNGMVEELIAEV